MLSKFPQGVYSAVFTGCCLSMTLATYTTIEPGWPWGICLLALVTVAVAALLITLLVHCLFEYLEVPGWVNYLLLLIVLTQWPLFFALLQGNYERQSLSVIMAGGVFYFYWPVLGILFARNFGHRSPCFFVICWGLSILLLLSCFTPLLRCLC